MPRSMPRSKRPNRPMAGWVVPTVVNEPAPEKADKGTDKGADKAKAEALLRT